MMRQHISRVLLACIVAILAVMFVAAVASSSRATSCGA